MQRDIKGKTAVITGASRGIGRGIAVAFAEKGIDVALIARSREALDEVKDECESHGVSVLTGIVDVSSEDDVVAFRGEVEKAFSKVDFLVQCAGQYLEKDFFDTTMDDWNNIIGSNLTGTYLLCREFGKVLSKNKNGGKIINFSSVGGRIGLEKKALYSASKFGVVGLSKALAKELQAYGILIHTIYPYMVDSLNERNWGNEESVLDCLKVEDVVELVFYLIQLPRRVVIEDIYLDTFNKDRI